jgi:hypothetical protein
VQVLQVNSVVTKSPGKSMVTEVLDRLASLKGSRNWAVAHIQFSSGCCISSLHHFKELKTATDSSGQKHVAILDLRKLVSENNVLP